jgi:hypothetical protein
MNLDDAKDLTIIPALIQVGTAFAIVWYLDSSKITHFFAPLAFIDKLHELTLVSSVVCQCIYQLLVRRSYSKGMKLSLNFAILLGGLAPLAPVAALTVLLWQLFPDVWDIYLGTTPILCYLVLFLMTLHTVRTLCQQPKSQGQ